MYARSTTAFITARAPHKYSDGNSISSHFFHLDSISITKVRHSSLLGTTLPVVPIDDVPCRGNISTAARRCRREARACGALEHPATVTTPGEPLQSTTLPVSAAKRYFPSLSSKQRNAVLVPISHWPPPHCSQVPVCSSSFTCFGRRLVFLQHQHYSLPLFSTWKLAPCFVFPISICFSLVYMLRHSSSRT